MPNIRQHHPLEWCGFCKRNVQRRDNEPNCHWCTKPFAGTPPPAQPFDVGDCVTFKPEGEERYIQGRVLAIAESEYAVSAVGAGHEHLVYWISKDEAVQP